MNPYRTPQPRKPSAEQRVLRTFERMALYLWVPLGVTALLWLGSMALWGIVYRQQPEPEKPVAGPCVDELLGMDGVCSHQEHVVKSIGQQLVCSCDEGARVFKLSE